jgi:DNA-directed RNA polymerase specialized sigma24 family protein
MADADIGLLQTALKSSDHEAAWVEFLECYAPIILQAVRYSIWDEERGNDCFVYVVEQLRAKRYRRLLQYRVDGGSSFSTWIRVVARNLALDWNRKESGRIRIFASIARLSPFHQEIYRLRQQKGLSIDETFAALRNQFPDATTETVAEANDLVEESLTPRQHWLLTRQRGQTAVLTARMAAAWQGAP